MLEILIGGITFLNVIPPICYDIMVVSYYSLLLQQVSFHTKNIKVSSHLTVLPCLMNFSLDFSSDPQVPVDHSGCGVRSLLPSVS